MNTPTEVQALNADIELGEAVKRLRKNKDFKKIIQGMYIDDGAKYLMQNYSVAKNRDSVEEQIMSRSHLYRFLSEVESSGDQALIELKDMQEDSNE